MAIITVPKPLRDRLGEDGSDALVQLINQATVEKVDVVALVEEKFERRLTAEISQLRSEMIERIESVRSELIGKIESVRSDLIKWMFLFWVGQIGAILGILFAFFRR